MCVGIGVGVGAAPHPSFRATSASAPLLPCCFCYCVFSNLDVGASGNYVQPIANVFLGAGGAVFWTTQNLYFGQCIIILPLRKICN